MLCIFPLGIWVAAVGQIPVGAEVGGDEGTKLAFICNPSELSLREVDFGVLLHSVKRHFGNLITGVGYNSFERIVPVGVEDPLVGDASNVNFVETSALFAVGVRSNDAQPLVNPRRAVVGDEAKSFREERVYVHVVELVGIIGKPVGKLIDIDPPWSPGTVVGVVVVVDRGRDLIQDVHEGDRDRLAVWGGLLEGNLNSVVERWVKLTVGDEWLRFKVERMVFDVGAWGLGFPSMGVVTGVGPMRAPILT